MRIPRVVPTGKTSKSKPSHSHRRGAHKAVALQMCMHIYASAIDDPLCPCSVLWDVCFVSSVLITLDHPHLHADATQKHSALHGTLLGLRRVPWDSASRRAASKSGRAALLLLPAVLLPMC